MTDAPTPDSLRPGSVVGAWRIEGYSGHGSYGAVFRARRDGLPNALPVALKMAVFAYDPRFVREASLLSRIHHPCVPQMLDRGWWIAGPEAAYPYLVMEWIPGLPLYDWARVYAPTPRQVLRVVAQVAWALDAVHRADALHRDVKGDNMRVEPQGRAVLLDYGAGTRAGAPPLTESLMPPGTHEYRSPEALRFQWEHWRQKGARYEATPADDLHALGVTTYRLVTGVYPPPGTDPEARRDPLRAPPPPLLLPQALTGRVVPELASLIERMLEQEPAARGQARELAEAAESAVEHAGPQADVPMTDAAPLSVERVVVPVRVVPMPGPERPAEEARMGAARASARPPAHAWKVGRGIAAAAGLLLLAGGALGVFLGWPVEPPAVIRAERQDEGTPSDDGTTGLGSSAPDKRVVVELESTAAKAIALEVPPQPVPGQRRPPCRRRGDVEINGGCWAKFELTPPCGDDKYEWRGACYGPLFERAQPRTSKKPR